MHDQYPLVCPKQQREDGLYQKGDYGGDNGWLHSSIEQYAHYIPLLRYKNTELLVASAAVYFATIDKGKLYQPKPPKGNDEIVHGKYHIKDLKTSAKTFGVSSDDQDPQNTLTDMLRYTLLWERVIMNVDK